MDRKERVVQALALAYMILNSETVKKRYANSSVYCTMHDDEQIYLSDAIRVIGDLYVEAKAGGE